MSAKNDTLNLGSFLFTPDSNTILSQSGDGSHTLVDTLHNWAITLKSYEGPLNLDSLVDIEFKVDTEYERDSLRFDSLGISYYFKYGRTVVNDTSTYVVFALAKQWEGVSVIFQNAMILEYDGSQAYFNQIHNVVFLGYAPPEILPIHNFWRFNKAMRAKIDGWVRIDGFDLRGRKK